MAHILLDFRQPTYIHSILCVPDLVPTKVILSITFQIGNRNMQPKELSEYNEIWSTNQQVRIYEQYLAKPVLVSFSIDLTKRVELILAILV